MYNHCRPYKGCRLAEKVLCKTTWCIIGQLPDVITVKALSKKCPCSWHIVFSPLLMHPHFPTLSSHFNSDTNLWPPTLFLSYSGACGLTCAKTHLTTLTTLTVSLKQTRMPSSPVHTLQEKVKIYESAVYEVVRHQCKPCLSL